MSGQERADQGWYPDPEAPDDLLRFWDGDRWTEKVKPRPQTAETKSDRSPPKTWREEPALLRYGTYGLLVLVGILVLTIALTSGGSESGTGGLPSTPSDSNYSGAGGGGGNSGGSSSGGGKASGGSPNGSSGGTHGFTGRDAENYKIAKKVCGAFPPEKVATQLGLSSGADFDKIGRAYADGYVTDAQQANYEGCVDGLLGQ